MPPKTASNKRKSARGTKKNPWVDEAFVMTSEKSPLVDIDLAKLFAKPEAWTCLDEEEKKEILSLLPESVHPDAEPSTENPDGIIPPLPGEFLRSTVWRDATRQFQLDLANGKYDPQWQKQAHKAVKERAEGKFDAKKERDFEAFWGQKQRYHTNVPAGDSATVDFKTLVTNGVFEVGDVWKYSRSQGKGAGKFLVEKELAVMSLDGETLTFAIPPGRRVFMPSLTKCQPGASLAPEPIPGHPVEREAKPDPNVEPRVKAEHEASSEEFSNINMSQVVSAEPQVCDPDRSIAQEYIMSNNQSVLTTDLATDPNQFSARYESCVDNKAIVETSIHQNRSGVNTAMDIDPSDDVSPCVESKVAKEIYGHTHMRFLGKPFIDELLDDSDDCSIMSDPPDMIDEIDDADFHRSLQELGPLPPSNTPYVPFNLKADPSDSRKVTSSTEPEVAVVGVLPTGHTDATNGTRPEQSNLLMPKDDTCESPTLTKTAIATETEPQVSEVSLQAHTSQSNGQESIRPKVDIDDNTQTETRAPDIWPETSNQPNLGSPGTLSTKPAATLEVPDKTSLPSEGKEAPVPESPNSVEPVIFPGVTGPMSLIRKIHELDGRESSARVANAWMLFRCIRNNQDMGTLWEVRHSWYTRSKR
ncbi:hypothetical protein H109_06170 [Trichophyton interdigitale MR816]|uniref:DEUBAD domain-containing protein n=1 Tax=Trichophyton interdigitale (strain MR816) TaxID=1215338 RepID=A0A059J217_TRIIM|nr:hypothetical protein H101_00124 [Trichophyton interdigitale H6]KDB21905.1 hypothetical protein H109_06170 [Trichophyton interdigitale MR816]